MNNAIPPSAYNYQNLLECTPSGIDDFGHASTGTMQEPTVTYYGTSVTDTIFSGTAEDPVPLFAFPIGWYIPLTLTEPDPTTLHVSGEFNTKCYPAYEVSVGGVDLSESFMPVSDDLFTITFCLQGQGEISIPISDSIELLAQGTHIY